MKRPAKALSCDEIIEAARGLIPLAREHADETDRNRRVSPLVFQAMQDAGLLHASKPRKYGGFELTPYEHAMVTLELARGCSSTAWVFSLLNSHSIWICLYPEEVQEEVWGEDSYIVAGSRVFASGGRSHADMVPGGYRLTGHFSFSSGSDFADWLLLRALVKDDGSDRTFLVRKSDVTVVDDWFTLGLRGSGSRTMVTNDLFVPERYAITAAQLWFSEPAGQYLHPTFDALHSRSPFAGTFLVAAPAAGAALGAVECFARSASTSTRTVANNRGELVELPNSQSVSAQLALAESAAEADLARDLIERDSREAAAFITAREPVPNSLLARINRDGAYATRLSLKATQRLFTAAGSKAIYEGDPIQRALRDIETAMAHVANQWERAAGSFAKAAMDSLGAEASRG
jgi:3-hydroxy-9,10-secoandrosta-1,3,5(10)-triene-9,17-dione monooxygenase